MEAVILCGGKDILLNKSAGHVPNTLFDINGKPVIWHVMNQLGRHGIRDFILPLGRKGGMIREYFNNYAINNHDYKLSLGENRITFCDKPEQDWNLVFADAGIDAQTGALLKRAEKHITQEPFLVMYGNGMWNVRIDKLLEQHEKMKRMATAAGTDYKSDKGILTVKAGVATAYLQKPKISLIVSAGLFAFTKGVFQYLSDDKNCTLEPMLLKKLTAIDELAVYKHDGFWMDIDTDKDLEAARHNYQFLNHNTKDA